MEPHGAEIAAPYCEADARRYLGTDGHAGSEECDSGCSDIGRFHCETIDCKVADILFADSMHMWGSPAEHAVERGGKVTE